jgi:uncharacterized protein YbjT (DUF2867 family)
MKAIVIGATGATGKSLVNLLLTDPDYREVVIFVRKSTERQHAKLTEHVVDLAHPESFSGLVNGDVFFSCLGTTLKDAGSKENQWKIDVDIPAKFAAVAKRNNVTKCVLVSAYGASKSSKLFYSRMKGELEEIILELAFQQTIIFKPGILERPQSDRIGEKIAVRAIRFLNTLGLFQSQRPLPTDLLAEKLTKAPKASLSGVTFVEKEAIFSL